MYKRVVINMISMSIIYLAVNAHIRYDFISHLIRIRIVISYAEEIKLSIIFRDSRGNARCQCDLYPIEM